VNVLHGTYNELVTANKALAYFAAGVDARTRTGPGIQSRTSAALGFDVIQRDRQRRGDRRLPFSSIAASSSAPASFWAGPAVPVRNIIETHHRTIPCNNSGQSGGHRSNLFRNNNQPGPSAADHTDQFTAGTS
jgi:hypothetical protein